jgi:RND family efflux transporter MFP subunit
MRAPDGGPHSEFPDAIARSEDDAVSLVVAPGTGARLKQFVRIGAGILLLCFVAVSIVRYFEGRALAKSAGSAAAAAPPVDVVTARTAGIGPDLVLPGQTAAWYETTLYARVSGYVASWAVDIGDHVVKGQVLATLETPELDAELTEARAQLQSSRAQVVAREAEAQFSKTTNERWRDSPKGVVSDQERESKKADYGSAQARLYAAQAQVALDKARVEQYRTLAGFKQVTAPFAGIITERSIDVGNLVTAGSAPATTPLYRISQIDPLRVFVEVPQSAAADLMKPGVPAEIRVSGMAGGGFAGTIARSAGAINPAARTMRVEVDVPNSQHALVSGMYVNVAFRLPSRGLVEVPAAALIFRSGVTQVAQVDSDERINFKDVVIARDQGSRVELLSGVLPGERLVLNISSQIRAGQRVSVNTAVQ